jgi:hypothetical protein
MGNTRAGVDFAEDVAVRVCSIALTPILRLASGWTASLAWRSPRQARATLWEKAFDPDISTLPSAPKRRTFRRVLGGAPPGRAPASARNPQLTGRARRRKNGAVRHCSAHGASPPLASLQDIQRFGREDRRRPRSQLFSMLEKRVYTTGGFQFPITPVGLISKQDDAGGAYRRESVMGANKRWSGKAGGRGSMVKDVMLMVPVACIVGFAMYTTIQRLDRTGKAARWQPAATAQIMTVKGRFPASFNPSDRKPIKFTALGGEVISLECYASRGIYSPSRMNTCLPLWGRNASSKYNKEYVVTYYTNYYKNNGGHENILLNVTGDEGVVFNQSISESSAPR